MKKKLISVASLLRCFVLIGITAQAEKVFMKASRIYKER